jgi:hypothetical protein
VNTPEPSSLTLALGLGGGVTFFLRRHRFAQA